MTPEFEPLTPLCVAIDALARALASGDPAAVLDAEAPLAAAAQALRSLPRDTRSGEERARLRQSVLKARAGLSRCRALGGSVAQLTVAMSGGPTAYGRAGGLVTSQSAVSSIRTRT